MTKEQIVLLAKQAGASRYTNRHYPDRPTHTFTVEQLELFATLVGNAKLEEAAEVCRDVQDRDWIINLKEPTP